MRKERIRRKVRWGLLFLPALILLVGCAVQRAYVSLPYTPEIANYSQEYGPIRIFASQLVDRRVKLQPDQLGVIRDEKGTPKGGIFLLRDEAPVEKLTEDIALLFKAAGVDVRRIPVTAQLSATQRRSVDAILSGEVRHFEVASDQRPLGDVTGNLEVYLQLVHPVTRQVIWSSTFTNSSERAAQILLSRGRQAVAEEIHQQFLDDLTKVLPIALGRIHAARMEEAF